MEQTLRPAHNGWQQEEIDMLWKEIRSAAETGAPLRGVFERMGQALGRKPNSVRNYYYMQLRDQAGDAFKRAAPFETFSENEVRDLVRQILVARGKGQSVRACVMALSGGDRALMLRYQNKYRSILRKKPDVIEEICQELKAEGLPCPQHALPGQQAPSGWASETEQALSSLDDPDVSAALTALKALAQRINSDPAAGSDRLKVQRDLLMMQLEDLQLACRDMIAQCKEFLGNPQESRAESLPGFCESLSRQVARLESISG